ncbi:hypothetical protein H5410_062677 [Solanum commersonii]|uniref:2,4-dienoyl-CoA reductase n=1 Tax=Solanum commersonii TaxID=4109 RepID=A0A9J5WC67_SOLCO|nr:hypothetical protein H5410_062677 [Solanum commersonii]
MEPWKDLGGKVVMVTGASSGIGLEFCLDLAKAGCNIIAAARRVDRLKSLCNQINSNSKGPPRAIAIQLDVTTDGATIESAVQIAWDAFGHIDALVNNAGITGNVHSSLELPEKEWDNVFNTNLKGAWLVSKYVCTRMRDAKQGGGSVINISSMAGLNREVFIGSLAYASSKMALDMLTKIMAVELGVDKIRVNSIAPGYFKSEITGSLMQKKWFDNYTKRTVPLRTLGMIDPALTSMVRYLIHDSSEYVSGNVFIVDAGTSLPEGATIESAGQLDVTADGATIESAVQIAWDTFGRIDVLVNNAGVTGKHSSLELSEEEWDNMFNTNLKGAWLVSKYVCRRMRDAKQGGGSVINISSMAGLNRVVYIGTFGYASSKMALDMVTKNMAMELGVDKIRVNSIAPGYFKSEITEGLMQNKWFNNVTRRTIPLRTSGQLIRL